MRSEPRFGVGDRVVMRKHWDWDGEAVATVKRVKRKWLPHWPKELFYYLVWFDVPQRKSTDDQNGVMRQRYTSLVAEEFLYPFLDLDPKPAWPASRMPDDNI